MVQFVFQNFPKRSDLSKCPNEATGLVSEFPYPILFPFPYFSWGNFPNVIGIRVPVLGSTSKILDLRCSVI